MKILLSVTNDLTYDQRMERICTSLAGHGHTVVLVGRVLPHSIPLEERPYGQYRLNCRFRKGILFYAEFNIRLFFYLLRTRCDAVCSADLDTLPAGCLATVLRGKKRVYDAHEYFTEVPEVTHRPLVKFFWAAVARLCLPFYKHAYTVGPALAAIFEKKYNIPFGVVRNVPYPIAAALPHGSGRTEDGNLLLLYQGALNEGRGIEQLLEALQHLDGIAFWLAGEGDLSQALRDRARALGVQDKVRFLGYVKPADLKAITAQAWLGANLFTQKGLNYYYSLANKFFDYVQAGIPVLTVDFPEYRALNGEHEVALLVGDLAPSNLAKAIRFLQDNPDVYRRLQHNTQAARQVWNWEQEERQLLEIWRQVELE